MTGYDVGALRTAEFPWADSSGPYFNHASTGPLPARTIRKLAEFNTRRAQPHLISQEEQFGILARSRDLCAELIGARPDDIALMVNTGYGINLAARSLGLSRGDVVLSVDREFPANVYPWMALGGDGVEFRQLPCANGVPDEDQVVDVIGSDSRVRVVTLSWVSFASGYTFDLKRLGEECAARDVHLVVDAMQGVGTRELDVQACNISVLACGGQKWLLSPWGTGFAYMRPDLVPRLDPPQVSWMSVKGSDDFSRLVDYDLTWRDTARKFEMVTMPYQDFAGMNESLELLRSLGTAAHDHIRTLTARLAQGAAQMRSVARVIPAETRRSGIVCVVPQDPVGVSRRLTEAGVVHSLREGGIRLSPHCYNTVDEVDAVLDVLRS